MIDVFASSTALLTSAVGNLVSNYITYLAVIVPIGLGFWFFWKMLAKGRKAVK